MIPTVTHVNQRRVRWKRAKNLPVHGHAGRHAQIRALYRASPALPAPILSALVRSHVGVHVKSPARIHA